MKKFIGKTAIGLVMMFLCFALGESVSTAAGEVKYTVTSLGTLEGGIYSKAYDINDSGWVVGEGDIASGSEIGVRGFLWKKETGIINVGAPGIKSSARGINNTGRVVGYMKPSEAPRVAFIWTETEGMRELPLSGERSEARGINNSDEVAGIGLNDDGQYRGFRWAGASENDLGTLGGMRSEAYSINDLGNLVGFSMTAASNARAFLWDGSMTELEILAGYQDSDAARINNRNQVVGRIRQCEMQADESCLFTGGQPFFWENRVMIGLGSLGGNDGKALGINDAGVVVGWSKIGEESEESSEYNRAFIWERANEAGGLVNLNDLIPGDSGWILMEAAAVNNQGQIVGHGILNGAMQAFLLTPIPQEDPQPKKPRGVKIDIRPWTHQNTINIQSRWGLVQIAILSDLESGFDAPSDVDPDSLTFGGTGEEDSKAFCMSWKADANGDRSKDLICYFYERPAGFECGDTWGTLKGQTVNNEPFEAKDNVKIVPCPPGRQENNHQGK